MFEALWMVTNIRGVAAGRARAWLCWMTGASAAATTTIGADADSSKLLDVPTGPALLLTETVSRDAQGGSLLHQQCICRADLFPLQVQVQYDTSGSGLRWQAAGVQPPA